ncbi:MAG: P-loop NTPase [Bacteroidales bacterium]|jgi:MinD superfamily P-loop ATPase|nr:ATP-binding protein [Bacteroidales bacterium]MCK9500089.1 ATP-binding protein [Bacteroidales bacterium]MDY0315600.1 ATP-binding protein [Bacteroidales bacterium]NLB87588.1 P-loop NTPase [Bacteroidales bacterium]
MEIAVISGKGGTGKSSITAAIANVIGNVVLADCDVDAANMYLLFTPEINEEKSFVGAEAAVIDYDICTNCGKCMLYCRFDAISKNKNDKLVISDVFCDGCGLCEKICPVNAITMHPSTESKLLNGNFRFGKIVLGHLAPGEENSGLLVNLVRKKAREISEIHNIEHIIIDGPPGIGCPVISTVTSVDYCIIVTEPSLSGLHDLKRTIELVESFKLNFGIIINKADLNVKINAKIIDLCKKNNYDLLGEIYFDPNFVDAMVNTKTIGEMFPKSVSYNIVNKITENILNSNI